MRMVYLMSVVQECSQYDVWMPCLVAAPLKTTRQAGRTRLARGRPVLKITHPYVSDSGHWEATWTGGGSAVADPEDELLAAVVARLGLP
jgi:hypothetical protein